MNLRRTILALLAGVSLTALARAEVSRVEAVRILVHEALAAREDRAKQRR